MITSCKQTIENQIEDLWQQSSVDDVIKNRSERWIDYLSRSVDVGEWLYIYDSGPDYPPKKYRFLYTAKLTCRLVAENRIDALTSPCWWIREIAQKIGTS